MSNETLVDLFGSQPLPTAGVFRSFQVAACEICSARTNRIEVHTRHSFYRQTRTEYAATCPNVDCKWHLHLQNKVGMRNDLHPKFYRDALEKEITVLKQRALKKMLHDVTGITDRKPSLIIPGTACAKRILLVSAEMHIGQGYTKMILSRQTT